jgi:hypothetical protein
MSIGIWFTGGYFPISYVLSVMAMGFLYIVARGAERHLGRTEF